MLRELAEAEPHADPIDLICRVLDDVSAEQVAAVAGMSLADRPYEEIHSRAVDRMFEMFVLV